MPKVLAKAGSAVRAVRETVAARSVLRCILFYLLSCLVETRPTRLEMKVGSVPIDAGQSRRPRHFAKWSKAWGQIAENEIARCKKRSVCRVDELQLRQEKLGIDTLTTLEFCFIANEP